MPYERVFFVRPKRIRVRRRIDRLLRQLVDTEAAKTVRVEIPAGLRVEADPAAFDRICANVIRNALQYGRPPITVSAGRGRGMIWLECEDVGRGVEPSFVPKLFDRFTRSAASALDGEGSGLGLANALFYARAHRGDLVYIDRPGSGACFRLVLPDTSDGAGSRGRARFAMPFWKWAALGRHSLRNRSPQIQQPHREAAFDVR